MATEPKTAIGTECRGAVAALERAIELPPLRAGQEADVAERLVVQARDECIAQLRRDGNTQDEGQYRATLDRLNTALSLIIGVEYPSGGVQREMIKQARDVLKDIDNQ